MCDPQTSNAITKLLKIPTIGIGFSSYCDGQILVTDDILGLRVFIQNLLKNTQILIQLSY